VNEIVTDITDPCYWFAHRVEVSALVAWHNPSVHACWD